MSKDDSMVSIEKLVLSNMLEMQASMRILECKKIINQDEILEEAEVLKKEMEEKIRRMGREN